MQERRRLPDGFLLMLLSHHFVVAFLVLTTFVVEPAVYNFMQTQKERQPCKIKASAINKKSARRRTRSGGPRPARTGAERRHRTFEPWQGSKIKERYHSVSFSDCRQNAFGQHSRSVFLVLGSKSVYLINNKHFWVPLFPFLAIIFASFFRFMQANVSPTFISIRAFPIICV